jgi:hypothetical protein
LRPGSTEIYGVIDVKCESRGDSSIPDGASCQSILGKYDLALTADEDIESVRSISYTEAAKDAFESGRIQVSLETAAKDSPLASLVVTGVAQEPTSSIAVLSESSVLPMQRHALWRSTCLGFLAFLLA